MTTQKEKYELIVDALHYCAYEWGPSEEKLCCDVAKEVSAGRLGDLPYGLDNGRIFITQEYIDLYFDGDVDRALELIDDALEVLRSAAERR